MKKRKTPVVPTTEEKKKKLEVVGCVRHPDGSAMPVFREEEGLPTDELILRKLEIEVEKAIKYRGDFLEGLRKGGDKQRKIRIRDEEASPPPRKLGCRRPCRWRKK